MYKHLIDGSKDIIDLQVWKLPPPPPEYHRSPVGILNGSIVLHDQEPFSITYIDNYRDHRTQKNKWRTQWLQLPGHLLLLEMISTCSWPIFCHSEKDSDDIKWLTDHGIIDCHYFWHGLISRDWFRHWKHHPDLQSSSQWTQRFLLYASGKTGTRAYRNTLINSLFDIKEQIKYDWDGIASVPSTYSATIDVKDAMTSAIHIVAETVFDQNKIHATEKVFKPVVMGQPFIIFAGPGMLQYLRSYGFKTFDHVWDESYDLETDHDRRFKLIIDLIKKLNSLSSQEFRSVMVKCQSVVQYNRQHFYSTQFESTMLSELKTNMEKSLAEQKERMLSDPGGSFFHVFDYLLTNNIEPFPAMQQWVNHLATQKNNDRVAQIATQYPWFNALYQI